MKDGAAQLSAKSTHLLPKTTHLQIGIMWFNMNKYFWSSNV